MSHSQYFHDDGGPGSATYQDAFLDMNVPFEISRPSQHYRPSNVAPQLIDDSPTYGSAGKVIPMLPQLSQASIVPVDTRPGGTQGSWEQYPMNDWSQLDHQNAFDFSENGLQVGLHNNPVNLLGPQSNESTEQAAILRHNMAPAVPLSLEGIVPCLKSTRANNNKTSGPDSPSLEITAGLCQSKKFRIEKTQRRRHQAKKSVKPPASRTSQASQLATSGQQNPDAMTICSFYMWMAKKPGVMPTVHEMSCFSLLFGDSFESVRNWFLKNLAAGQGADGTGYQTMTGSNTNIEIAAVSKRRRAHCNRKAEKLPGQGNISVRVERDESRPYPCTSRCGKNFNTKAGWKRHEEMNHPPNAWSCNFSGCRNRRKRVYLRRDKFGKHLHNAHPDLDVTPALINTCCIPIKSNFSKHCLFYHCKKRLKNWKERIDHVGDHFTKDKWNVAQWRSADEEEESDDADGSDTDDSKTDETQDSDSVDDSDHSDPSDDSNTDKGIGHSSNRYGPRLGSNLRNQRPSGGSQGHGSWRETFSGVTNFSSRYQLNTSGQNLNMGLHGNFIERSDGIGPGISNNDALPPATTKGPCIPCFHSTVFKSLGCGSEARVDEVKVHGYKGTVARKVIHRRSLSKQRDPNREARNIVQLLHPHIIRLIGSYSNADKTTLLLLPVADCNLSQYLYGCSAGILADEPIWDWFNCLSAGLHYIHERGVRHRDIKPSNILVKDHRILYSDFGSSNLVAEEESDDLERADFAEQYAAPEVYRGERGRAADVFSLGCVFSDMVATILEKPINGLRPEEPRTGRRRRQWVTETNRCLRSEATKVSASPSTLSILDCCETMTRFLPNQRPNAAEIMKRLSPCRCGQVEASTELEKDDGWENVLGHDAADTATDDSCNSQVLPSLVTNGEASTLSEASSASSASNVPTAVTDYELVAKFSKDLWLGPCKLDSATKSTFSIALESGIPREKMRDRYLSEHDPFSELLVTGRSRFTNTVHEVAN